MCFKGMSHVFHCSLSTSHANVSTISEIASLSKETIVLCHICVKGMSHMFHCSLSTPSLSKETIVLLLNLGTPR